MQFTSLAYLGFFAAVFAVHWAVPQKARWAVCLAASAGFYALLGAPMLAVLALCIAVSYLGGLWLQRRRGRRPALALAAAAALAPLLFFKYFNTLLGAYVPESVRAFSLLTPVGISFFTFKAVAYLAEVYKGALPPCRHFGRYALYVSFFPEVSMGPIQRPGDLMAQIGTPRAFDAGRAVRGAQLMLWGYFEKLVVADNLAPYVSAGLDAPDLVMGLSVFLASVLYAVQLYADFAGYSHIAIGCMQLLGFDVPENFRAPYFSTSVKEFWNRWHISLSSWLRDYVYIPLGGNRKHQIFNICIVWFLTGLWHGASWNFILWGVFYGVLLIVEKLGLLKVLEKIPSFFSHLYLLFITLIGWTIFYTTDLGRLGGYLSVMFGLSGNPLTDTQLSITFLNRIFWLAAAILFCMPVTQWVKGRLQRLQGEGAQALACVGTALMNLTLLFVCTSMLVGDSYNPFLYFRF